MSHKWPKRPKHGHRLSRTRSYDRSREPTSSRVRASVPPPHSPFANQRHAQLRFESERFDTCHYRDSMLSAYGVANTDTDNVSIADVDPTILREHLVQNCNNQRVNVFDTMPGTPYSYAYLYHRTVTREYETYCEERMREQARKTSANSKPKPGANRVREDTQRGKRSTKATRARRKRPQLPRIVQNALRNARKKTSNRKN